jgi:hypothetical protein
MGKAKLKRLISIFTLLSLGLVYLNGAFVNETEAEDKGPGPRVVVFILFNNYSNYLFENNTYSKLLVQNTFHGSDAFNSAFDPSEGSLWYGGGDFFEIPEKEKVTADRGPASLDSSKSAEDLGRFGKCSGKWFDLRCGSGTVSNLSSQVPTLVMDVSQSMYISDPTLMGECARSRVLVELKNEGRDANLYSHAEGSSYVGSLKAMSVSEIHKRFCKADGGNNLVDILSKIRKEHRNPSKPILVVTDSAEGTQGLYKWLDSHNGIDAAVNTSQLASRLKSEMR